MAVWLPQADVGVVYPEHRRGWWVRYRVLLRRHGPVDEVKKVDSKVVWPYITYSDNGHCALCSCSGQMTNGN